MQSRIIDILKQNPIAQTVYYNSSLGVCITDENARILDVNNRFCQIYGYTGRETVIGKPANTTFHDDEKEKALSDLKKTIVERGSRTEEYSQVKSNGSTLEVAVSISVFTVDEITYSISFIQDISDYGRTNRLLRETEKMTGVGAWEVDLNTEEAFWTDTVYDIYGVDKSTFTDLKMALKFYPPEERKRTERVLQKLISKSESYTIEQRFIDNNGYEKWVRATGHPILIDGKVARIYGTFTDITQEKEERLHRERLSRVASETPNAVIILNAEMQLIWANEGFTKMTGFTLNEVEGKYPGDFLTSPQTTPEKLQTIEYALLEKKELSTEIIQKRKNGETFWANLQITPVFDEQGNIKEYFSIQEDITERKKQQIAQKKALEEKTYLLAEIHHRVKNNLATISGLIELQKFTTADPNTKDVLEDSVNRIKSMSEVHEMLYKSDRFNEIDIASYTGELIERTAKSFDRNKIKGIVSAENVKLGLNVALPVALLINELVTNSFKHAFPNSEEGVIKVNIEQDGPTVQITYEDNGIGLQEEHNFKNPAESTSLGRQLIHTFLEQIEADYKIKKQEQGFWLRFTFKNVDIKESWLNKVKT